MLNLQVAYNLVYEIYLLNDLVQNLQHRVVF